MNLLFIFIFIFLLFIPFVSPPPPPPPRRSKPPVIVSTLPLLFLMSRNQFMFYVQRAMQKLLRGNELELAVSVGLVLEDVGDLTSIAAELLSRRCEKLGRW